MPTTRWKLATFVLGVTSIALVARGDGDREPTAMTASATEPAPRSQSEGRRQLRIFGPRGIDEAGVIRQLREERDARRTVVLCEKLGAIGTDRAIAPLGELAGDRRAKVATAALRAIGQI